MADEADMAQEREQQLTAEALAHREEEAPKEVTGKCFWCDEPLQRVTMSMVSGSDELEKMRRWCGPECRDLWEIWKRRKK